MITRGHMYALAELARLAVKHKGNRAAITAELEADKEWARFCARHGLPRNTERPPATAIHPDDLARRDEALYQAWTIIANAYVDAAPGPATGWDAAPAEWRAAAERWRDEQFHPLLAESQERQP